MPDHLDHDLSVPALAYRTHLSERQFRRVFKRGVGTNPVDHIARTCGFGTPETMNRAFRRRLNTTPGDHRHHFGETATPAPAP